MKPLITPAQMRDMEGRYFAQTGMPSVELMERVGAIDYTWNEAVRLVQDAKTRLTPGEYANDTYEVLLSMADFFVRRAG